MNNASTAKPCKVSVIVPIHNAEPWLARCLDSVIGQTLREIELILVDDGSTDNSLAIANDYAKNDARVKVIRQENAGCAAARNAALSVATGEYVGFVDADDYKESALRKLKIEQQRKNSNAA